MFGDLIKEHGCVPLDLIEIVMLDDVYKGMHTINDQESVRIKEKISDYLVALGIERNKVIVRREIEWLKEEDEREKAMRDQLHKLLKKFAIQDVLRTWNDLGLREEEIKSMKIGTFLLPLHLVSTFMVSSPQPDCALIGALDRPFLDELRRMFSLRMVTLCMPAIENVKGRVIAMGSPPSSGEDPYIIVGDTKSVIEGKLVESFKNSSPLSSSEDRIHLSIACIRILSMLPKRVKEEVEEQTETGVSLSEPLEIGSRTFKNYHELEMALRRGDIALRPFANWMADRLDALFRYLTYKTSYS